MSDGLPTEAAPFWAPITALIGAALGAFGLWLANRMMGKAAFQTAINSGFKELTDQLQEERQTLRKALEDERIEWAAERAQLRGEIINLTQALDSLKHLLIRHGIAIPMSVPGQAPSFTVIKGSEDKT